MEKDGNPAAPAGNGGGNSARLCSLTPVCREYRTLISFDQPTDATGVSQLLEKLFQSQAIMSMQLVLGYHRAALLQAPPQKKNRLWS
jgi:hypothetical protein